MTPGFFHFILPKAFLLAKSPILKPAMQRGGSHSKSELPKFGRILPPYSEHFTPEWNGGPRLSDSVIGKNRGRHGTASASGDNSS